MRRRLAALLALLFLVSCAPDQSTQTPETEIAPVEIAAAIAERQADLPEMISLDAQNEDFFDYVSDYYRISAAVEDGAVCYASGAQAHEIAVLLLGTQEAAEQAVSALEEYLARRIRDFTGYSPQQAALAENSRVLRQNCYAVLLICPDMDLAEETFFACLNGDPLPEPLPTPEPGPEPEPLPEPEPEPIPEPEPDDIYDPAAILAAWKNGDDSGLTEKNRAILDACRTVIDTFLSDNMREYEKELTIHDWMVGWGSYDENALSHGSDDRALPDSDNPYGFFTQRQGICLGYATTFQLFMDLLDIECITVHGTAYSDREAHAWNMVCLDGQWYCVDVTWDDPIINGSPVSSSMQALTDPIDTGLSDPLLYKYFNVTSDYMRQTSHFWDTQGVPEATTSNPSQSWPFFW